MGDIIGDSGHGWAVAKDVIYSNGSFAAKWLADQPSQFQVYLIGYSLGISVIRAVSVHQTYADHELSFTDAMTAVMIEYHEIDGVLSFENDFDGIVSRLAPDTLTFR